MDIITIAILALIFKNLLLKTLSAILSTIIDADDMKSAEEIDKWLNTKSKKSND